MPFSEPLYSADHIEEVRKIGRIATLLNELRAEYEARRRGETLDQMLERINDLCQLRTSLSETLEQDRREHEENGGLSQHNCRNKNAPCGAHLFCPSMAGWVSGVEQ